MNIDDLYSNSICPICNSHVEVFIIGILNCQNKDYKITYWKYNEITSQNVTFNISNSLICSISYYKFCVIFPGKNVNTVASAPQAKQFPFTTINHIINKSINIADLQQRLVDL